MNVVTARRLKEFWIKHPTAEAPLRNWLDVAVKAEWADGHAVREDFRSADFVSGNRVIFDIGGNNYRLMVRISYRFKQVLVKVVGAHAEYDKIDPNTV